MPFDGSEFATKAAVTGLDQPGLWDRLMRWTLRWGRSGSGVLAFEELETTPGKLPDFATLQLLRLARALIEDERHWVQHHYKTLRGRRCAVGALIHARRLLALRSSYKDARDVLLMVAVDRGYSAIEKMNDVSSHEQMLSAFDTAIARVQARL